MTTKGPFVYRFRTPARAPTEGWSAGRAGFDSRTGHSITPTKWWNWAGTDQRLVERRSERRAARHGSSTLPLVTEINRRRRTGVQRSLISFDPRACHLPLGKAAPTTQLAGYANR